MGCRKCAERRAAEERARAAAQAAREKSEREAAERAFLLASAWHRWGWQFIHRFTMAIPPGTLDVNVLQHVRRIVQLFIEVLPCKDCQGHATAFLAGGDAPRLGRVKTGQALAFLLHELHNDVNRRTGKPEAGREVLHEYRSVNLRNAHKEYIDAVLREPPVPMPAIKAMDMHLKALGL
jgi:hypothetical protein